jgi:hypothetical protein
MRNGRFIELKARKLKVQSSKLKARVGVGGRGEGRDKKEGIRESRL